MKRFLLILSLFFIGMNAYAQLVGGEIFLKGSYCEVGSSANGAYGTKFNAPVGYHARPGVGSPAATPSRLGFVADPAKDGWTVGVPNYFGDYFLPAQPFEGWNIQRRSANEGRAWNTGPPLLIGLFVNWGSYTLSGSNTSFGSTGSKREGVWMGMYDSLTIKQVTRLDTTKTYFVTEVTIKNISSVIKDSIFYNRCLDPDNETATPGAPLNFATINTIVRQPNSATNNKCLVTAVGLTFGAYLGLGTVDCRAKCYVTENYYPQPPSICYYNPPAGYLTAEGATNTTDRVIGLVFNLGSLAAGDSTTLKYSYILNLSDLDSAFAELAPTFLISGTTPAATNDTIYGCVGDSIPISIIGGAAYSFNSWSPASSLISSAGTDNIALVQNTPVTYTIIGTTLVCSDTIRLKLTVAPRAVPDAGIHSAISVCNAAAPINLLTHLSGTPAAGGFWTGPSVSPIGIFTSSGLPLGTYNALYTTTNGACTDTASVSVMVINDTLRTFDTVNVCAGSSYTFLGTTYTTSGTYFFSYTSVVSCDSIHALTIEVLPLLTDTISVSICAGSSYLFGGVPRSSSGTYLYTSSLGVCDTFKTLNLIVADSIIKYDTVAICSGGNYNYSGSILTAAGTYSYTYLSAAGCDSIYRLTLKVNPILTENTTGTICEGSTYLFGGIARTTSGIFTYTDTAGPCDTFKTLDLTVFPKYRIVDPVNVCRNTLPITVAGIIIPIGAISNPLYDSAHFVTAQGCDSNRIINLTVRDTSSSSIDTLLCYGSSYNFFGNVIFAPGLYTHTISNTAGCDSALKLNIAFTPAPIVLDTLVSNCGAVVFFGTTYTTSKMFTQTYPYGNGCDSFIRNVSIVVKTIGMDTTIAAVCEGEQYDFLGQSYSSNTVLTKKLIGQNGCDSFATLILTVNTSPVITFERLIVDQEPVCTLDTITLQSRGAATYGVFNQDFVLLGNSDMQRVLVPNPKNKFYVIGSDDNGCTDTAGIMIEAEPCCETVMPSAFSPNGDGQNDRFGPMTFGNPEDYELQVFNRFGERVFVSFQINTRWDGTIKGEAAPMGVYFYAVKGKCFNGAQLFLKGDITLIR